MNQDQALWLTQPVKLKGRVHSDYKLQVWWRCGRVPRAGWGWMKPFQLFGFTLGSKSLFGPLQFWFDPFNFIHVGRILNEFTAPFRLKEITWTSHIKTCFCQCFICRCCISPVYPLVTFTTKQKSREMYLNSIWTHHSFIVTLITLITWIQTVIVVHLEWTYLRNCVFHGLLRFYSWRQYIFLLFNRCGLYLYTLVTHLWSCRNDPDMLMIAKLEGFWSFECGSDSGCSLSQAHEGRCTVTCSANWHFDQSVSLPLCSVCYDHPPDESRIGDGSDKFLWELCVGLWVRSVLDKQGILELLNAPGCMSPCCASPTLTFSVVHLAEDGSLLRDKWKGIWLAWVLYHYTLQHSSQAITHDFITGIVWNT